MTNAKYACVLFYLIIVKSTSQPVPLSTETLESFEAQAQAIRVKRQAGYVYDKPSVSLALPTRAPTVSTQAPTVDRTQAQMMFYAYPAPAPAAGSNNNAVNIGGSAGTTGGGTATASAGTASAGYNYGAQNSAPAGPQSTGSAPTNTGSAQTSNAGTSGYGYGAPSVGTANGGVDSTQTSNAGSSQTSSSSSASGYAYIAPSPTNNQAGSGATQTADVSTKAPQYLPPAPGGVNSNNIGSGYTSTGTGISGSVSGGSVAPQPPLDQYLPPLNQPNPPASLAPTGPLINVGVPSTGPGPSSNYIPPDRAPLPLPSNNATPRPFAPAPAPAPPPTGYLPPNVISQVPVQNFASTPASAYLPPTL